MASTDVSRWCSRPPLSLYLLHLRWFHPGKSQRYDNIYAPRVYQETTEARRKAQDPEMYLDDPNDVTKMDVLPDCFQNHSRELFEGLIPVEDEMHATEMLHSVGIRQSPGPKLTTMTSTKGSRAFLSPSDRGDNPVGVVTEAVAVDTVEEQLDCSKSSSSSFYFNMKECLDTFCALSIHDSADEEKHVEDKPDCNVSNLMHILKEIGVTASPRPYFPRDQRMASSEIFCKNLFLKDRRGQFYLVICDEDADLDLKSLRRKVNANRNFSFANSAELMAILKSNAGGVTPLAVMHETARDIRIFMTTDVARDDVLLNFHPLDHNMTLPIELQQLKRFLCRFRFDLEFVDMSE